jgi:NADH-quinone oxidoreductase subunit K
MAAVPMTHGLMVAGALFSLGLLGVLVRRNIIFILMSIEVMLNAAGLAFVVVARGGGKRTGRSCSCSS